MTMLENARKSAKQRKAGTGTDDRSATQTQMPRRPDTSIAVVLGMHRSGTSALTRSLSAFGYEFGDNLMPPVENNNPKGFWEDRDINRVNVQLMSALGVDWDAFQPLMPDAPASNKSLSQLRLQGLALLRAKVAQHPSFAIKDPRMARLLPFWSPLLARSATHVRFIVALRNPLSVALSLRARDGFEKIKSYYLWLAHMLDLYFGVVAHCRQFGDPEAAGPVVVDYDRLMSDPLHQLQRVRDHLGLGLSLQGAAIEEYVGDYLDASLTHSSFDLSDLELEPELPAEVATVFRLFDAASRGEAALLDDTFSAAMAHCRQRFMELAPILEFGSRSAHDFSRMRASAEQRARTIADLQKAAAEMEKKLFAMTELRQQMESVTQRATEKSEASEASSQREAATLRTELGIAAARLEMLEANMQRARDELELARQERQALATSLEAAGQSRVELQVRLAAVEAERAAIATRVTSETEGRAELERRLAEAEIRHEKAQQQLEHAAAAAEHQVAELASERSRRLADEARIESLGRELDALRKARDELAARLDGETRAGEVLASRLEQATSELKALVDRLATGERERKTIENARMQLATERDGLAARLEAETRERESLERRLAQLGKECEARVGQHASEVKELEERLGKAESALRAHEVDARLASHEVEGLRTRASVSASEIAQLSRRILVEQDEANAARRERDVLSAHLLERRKAGLDEHVLNWARALLGLGRVFSGEGRRQLVAKRLIRKSGLFDPDWYLSKYPDVLVARIDPLEHFIRFGARERRSPGPGFDTSWYVATNPDVGKSRINPLVHWLRHGRGEGRVPRPGTVAG